MLHALRKLLFDRIDIAGLAAFRIAFGMLMALDTLRYIALGWVRSHFIEPPMLFKYLGFEWVGVLPAPLMYGVFGMMAAAGLAIAFGVYYRLSCALFALGHTYVFLVAASYYLNHAYLISVIAFVMMLLPAHRALSVDALRKPHIFSQTIPRWPLVLLIGMLAVVYVYGAIAKITPDWLAGEPMRHWLQGSAARVPYLKSLVGSETGLWLVVYGGLLFDLLVVPAMLWKRTRLVATCASVLFHLTNSYIFNIGIFPWFMLAATTLFFEPSWPRHLPLGFGESFSEAIDQQYAPDETAEADEYHEASPAVVTRLLVVWFAVQLLLPLRHHLYPGYVGWTDEAHYFSWRMKLRDKRGRLSFRLVIPKTGQTWQVWPHEQLTPRQQRKVIGKPDLLLQYAHYLRDAYSKQKGTAVSVYADAFVSLNYRREQRYVVADIDLAKEPKSLLPYRWITTFEDTPLRSGARVLQSFLAAAGRRAAVESRQRLRRQPR